MSPTLDVTVQAGPLAEAAGRLSRLLPTRSPQPAQAGVMLRADGDGLLLVAADGELSARLRVPATTHEPGEVVISRRGLAETMATLDVPEVRLVAEGSRLAVRTPGARFALPRLADARPAALDLPPAVGSIAGAALRAAVVPVAGAASREHALPIFTGVRVRSAGDRLSLLATDRYRLAAADVAWCPAGAPDTATARGAGDTADHGASDTAGHGASDTAGRGDDDAVGRDGGAGSPGRGRAAPTDALVPAATFAEIARQAGRAETVTVHAGGELFGLAWAGGDVVTATLGDSFPDVQLDRLLQVDPECVVDIEADALAGAVDRASRYAGPQGRISVQVGDGVVTVRASDPLTGESEEAVKATVQGDLPTRHYQTRLLGDALRPFAAQTVRVRIQAGTRATEFSAADDAPPVGLRYLVVPLRPTETGTI
jgi:DNA polymerase-3 subunit beta